MGSVEKIKILYDSWNLFFKCPFGAVKSNDKVILRLAISDLDQNLKIKKVILKLVKDEYSYETLKEKNYIMSVEKEPPKGIFRETNIDSKKSIYNCTIDVGIESKLVFYYFEIYLSNNKVIYYGNNKRKVGGLGEIYENNPIPYQITVYSKELITPKWLKHSIMYQIFVDRFFNGNDDFRVLNPRKNCFIYGNWYDKPMYIKDSKTNEIIRWDFYGGNIKGIIKKLDYLKDLGINLIYLNPIFESVSNHKYDTADYKKIDRMYGDLESFKELVQLSRSKGIYIILDGVFNHTGSDSIYFNKYKKYESLGAYQSKDSKYYNWYNFNKYPQDYDCWWGVKDLPCVNEMEKSYLDYIIKDNDSVINYWMNTGIKGWRLDVADELPDEFIELLKKQCKQKDEDSIVIGEVWEDASNKISYDKRRKYFINQELDSVTNYVFRDNLIKFFSNDINAEILYENLMSVYENYPIHNFYSLINVIGTHDVERIATILKKIVIERGLEKEYSLNKINIETSLEVICKGNESFENIDEYYVFKLLKLIVLIQFTFPGVPHLYYGDEAGLYGEKDPCNRACYPWGKENKNILKMYKQIIKIRKENSILSTGYWKPFYIYDDIYGYIRYHKKGKDCFGDDTQKSIIIVLVNRSFKEKYNIELKVDENILENYDRQIFVNLFNENEKTILQEGILRVYLEPLEGKILVLKT
ncbi:glycoside hydrolase family 13 protein [Haloimpatiens sp. FM7330]|uniref:glycoside hydrolase family 13 protein n=1 Tax=Haloimpatiens sp. FM7330 TaxID=3298610 RepID=UPI003632D6BE